MANPLPLFSFQNRLESRGFFKPFFESKDSERSG
jgi:hypothetical protein